jgi:hypothetical protein
MCRCEPLAREILPHSTKLRPPRWRHNNTASHGPAPASAARLGRSSIAQSCGVSVAVQDVSSKLALQKSVVQGVGPAGAGALVFRPLEIQPSPVSGQELPPFPIQQPWASNGLPPGATCAHLAPCGQNCHVLHPAPAAQHAAAHASVVSAACTARKPMHCLLPKFIGNVQSAGTPPPGLSPR